LRGSTLATKGQTIRYVIVQRHDATVFQCQGQLAILNWIASPPDRVKMQVRVSIH
jgi:hypothetical protein